MFDFNNNSYYNETNLFKTFLVLQLYIRCIFGRNARLSTVINHVLIITKRSTAIRDKSGVQVHLTIDKISEIQ